MKLINKELGTMVEQVNVLCDALTETESQEFMEYVSAKYPTVAVALFDLVKRNIEYSISIL